MQVVKLGGSLWTEPRLQRWLEAIAADSAPRIVVPGGGPFADRVREAQAAYGLDDLTAHRLAILAMQQHGCALLARAPWLRPVQNLAEIEALGGLPGLWLPWAMVGLEPSIAASWDVTSDSLSAWLGRHLEADDLLLVKAARVPVGDASIDELVALGLVDGAFAAFTAGLGCRPRLASVHDEPAVALAMPQAAPSGLPTARRQSCAPPADGQLPAAPLPADPAATPGAPDREGPDSEKGLPMKPLIFSLAMLTAVPAVAAPQTFTFDVPHTQVYFRVNHLGFSNTHGTFKEFAGQVVLDQDAPEASKVSFKIDAASLDTDYAKRDEHLRSKDFFDVAKHPDITFTSTKVEKTGDKTAKVTGDLTLLGVTKPVVLDVTLNQMAVSPINNKLTAGFTALTTIKRTEFGMMTYAPALGDDISIVIDAEALAS